MGLFYYNISNFIFALEREVFTQPSEHRLVSSLPYHDRDEHRLSYLFHHLASDTLEELSTDIVYLALHDGEQLIHYVV